MTFKIRYSILLDYQVQIAWQEAGKKIDMELLCLKSDRKYLHITSDTFELTSMSKASVYQVTESDTVKALFCKFKGELKDLHVVKLTIIEEIVDL